MFDHLWDTSIYVSLVQDCSQRETAEHPQNLLQVTNPNFQQSLNVLLLPFFHVSCFQRQPPSRRVDERAADGDDRAESAGDPGLVPEQTVQGKPENINSPKRNILKILLKFFKDKKIQNRMIEKQLQGEKVDTSFPFVFRA